MNRVRPVGLVCVVALSVSVVLGVWITRPNSDARKSPPATHRTGGASFDLASVIRRVHFSFRAEGTTLRGGDATYAVVVDGAHVRVRPATYTAERAPRTPARARPPRPPTATLGASLDLETTGVDRSGANLLPHGAPVVDARGHSVRAGASVTEELENRPHALEQSWHFARRPAGTGDVTVRVRATGLAFARATGTGLHFVDPTTRLGVRYGHATWVDGRGTKSDVPARWNGSEIAMNVPARVVDASAYPAVLDPSIGPEQGVDVPVTGPGSGSEVEPSVAYNGSEYFVVWKDFRESANFLIFGTRVSAAGNVLDPYGIAISPPSLYAASPSVVWDGTTYLVVFEQIGKIVGRRFDAEGKPVDADAFPINDLGTGQYSPVAVNDGTETLVVWQDQRNSATTGWDIYGTRVVGSTPVDGVSAGMPIVTVPGDQYTPRVAYGGGDWLVTYEDHQKSTDGDVYAVRIRGSTGAVLDSAPIAVSTGSGNQSAPWPASDGTDFLVVWYDDRNNPGAYTDVYGARIASATGAVSDGAGIQICNDIQYQTQPSVAYNGGSYQVVWEEYRGNGLYGNRVAPATGALLDGGAGKRLDGGAIDSFFQAPRIFATGGGFYLTWNSTGSEVGTQGLRGSRLTVGQVIEDAPGKVLASSANGQTYVDLASNGSDGWFAVWRDDRAGSPAIYGARIDSNGTSKDSAGILLSEGGMTETMPTVAYNGTNWLVAWADSRPSYSMALYGTRVEPATGAVLDPAGLELTSAPAMPLYPQAASDGTGWFIAWTDYAQPGLSIYGGRVNSSGVALDGRGVLISQGSSTDSHQYPEIAYGNGTYLVIWSDGRVDPTGALYGARVNPSGVVQDVDGIAVSTAPSSVYSGSYGVAHAGSDFTLAWIDGATLMRGRVAPTSGAVSDVSALTPVSTGCCLYAASLAFDGTNFLAAYSSATASGYHILGTRFAPDGTDLDANDFFISGDPGITADGAVLSAIPGQFLAAYTRYDPTPGVTSDRLRLRTIASTAGVGGAGGGGGVAQGGASAVGGAGGSSAASGGASSGGTSTGGASTASGGTSTGGTSSGGTSSGGTSTGGTSSGGTSNTGGSSAGEAGESGAAGDTGGSVGGGCATHPTSQSSDWTALAFVAFALRRRRRASR